MVPGMQWGKANLLATVLVFIVVIFFQGFRVELPVVYAPAVSHCYLSLFTHFLRGVVVWGFPKRGV